MDNKLLVSMAKEMAEPAGYPGLLTARKFHDVARQAGIYDTVEETYGRIRHCWATVADPGTPGIPEHSHNTATVVYYPHDHAVGTWVEGEYYPAVEGELVWFDEYVMHHVEPNDTDETRVTVIFTLEKK